MRKWRAICVCIISYLLVLTPSSYAAAASLVVQQQAIPLTRVAFTLDGKPLQSHGIVKQGITMVPLQLLTKDLKLAITYEANQAWLTLPNGSKLAVDYEADDYVTVKVDDHIISDHYERQYVSGNNYISIRLLTDLLGYRALWDGTNKTVHLMRITENKAHWATETIQELTTNVSILIQYPQIRGLKDQNVEQEINELFAQDARDYAAAAREASNGAYEDVGFRYEYTSNYMVKYNSNNMISVLWRNDEYTGGSHDQVSQHSYTIHLGTGKVYTLDDLLSASPNYKELINAKLVSTMTEYPDYANEFGGITDRSAFYLKNEGVVIYFDTDEDTSDQSGMISCYVSFRDVLPQLDGTLPF